MIDYKKIDGGELGEILLRRNPRSKSYSLRIDGGRVYASMPTWGNQREMMAFIREQNDRIKKMLLLRPARQILDEQTDFRTPFFRLQITKNNLSNIYTCSKDGVLSISCPEETDFSDTAVQQKLWNIVENTIRAEAKRILPERVSTLAERYGFVFESIKINNSRTHWGSCTAQKHINLSLSLMLLPQHLIDYVLLHELCHTVEMNHSQRFWTLMDKVTGGMALTYRKEMKYYRML